MMYIPEYITVVMDNVQDYKKIYEKGFSSKPHNTRSWFMGSKTNFEKA